MIEIFLSSSREAAQRASSVMASQGQAGGGFSALFQAVVTNQAATNVDRLASEGTSQAFGHKGGAMPNNLLISSQATNQELSAALGGPLAEGAQIQFVASQNPGGVAAPQEDGSVVSKAQTQTARNLGNGATGAPALAAERKSDHQNSHQKVEAVTKVSQTIAPTTVANIDPQQPMATVSLSDAGEHSRLVGAPIADAQVASNDTRALDGDTRIASLSGQDRNLPPVDAPFAQVSARAGVSAEAQIDALPTQAPASSGKAPSQQTVGPLLGAFASSKVSPAMGQNEQAVSPSGQAGKPAIVDPPSVQGSARTIALTAGQIEAMPVQGETSANKTITTPVAPSASQAITSQPGFSNQGPDPSTAPRNAQDVMQPSESIHSARQLPTNLSSSRTYDIQSPMLGKVEKPTGEGTLPKSTASNSSEAPTAIPNVIPKIKNELPVASEVTNKALAHTAGSAQINQPPFVALQITTEPQGRSETGKAGQTVLNPTTFRVDQSRIATELQSVRVDAQTPKDGNQPAQPNPNAPASVLGASVTSSNTQVSMPEYLGDRIGTLPPTDGHEDQRSLLPNVLGPQSADARGTQPQNTAPTGTPATPPKPMAEALLSQVRSVDVQDGRTTINLHPRGLGKIEVEVFAERDVTSKVVVKVENPMVLQTLRDERHLLAEAIGIADSNVMAFEDTTANGNSFAGTEDDGEAPSAVSSDKIEDKSVDHKDVVNDDMLDVVT